MPNSQFGSLEEPGKRSGEGLDSLLPHLQRQQQSQIKPKKPNPPDAEGPESESFDQDADDGRK